MTEILNDPHLLERQYIGDAVYVANDRFQIWLATFREGREERIALEPSVLNALIKYAIDKGFLIKRESS